MINRSILFAVLALCGLALVTVKSEQPAANLCAGLLCVGMLNVRSLKDANLLVTKALPAAAASNTSDTIDLGTTTPGRLADPCPEILIELPATPSLVDAKTVTLTLEDSADGSSFATLASFPAIVVTGSSGAGGGAVEQRVKIPIECRRYIRLAQAVLTGGGSNVAISSTLSIVH